MQNYVYRLKSFIFTATFVPFAELPDRSDLVFSHKIAVLV